MIKDSVIQFGYNPRDPSLPLGMTIFVLVMGEEAAIRQ
jgi:hypothetical protein